jgi:hypothetical protein
MRCHRLLPLVLAALFVPATASADGFIRWLGRLSGPGPFFGFGCELPVARFPTDGEPQAAVQQDTSGIADSACRRSRPDRRELVVSVNLMGAIAKDNPIDYPEGSDESRGVALVKAGVAVDWTVHDALDVGVGSGLVYFAGRGSTTSRAAISSRSA